MWPGSSSVGIVLESSTTWWIFLTLSPRKFGGLWAYTAKYVWPVTFFVCGQLAGSDVALLILDLQQGRSGLSLHDLVLSFQERLPDLSPCPHI